MMLPLPLHRESIAVILDKDGQVIDEAFVWETVENFAMHDFDCASIVCISGDPHSYYFYTDAESLQAMADSRLRDRRDCFGE